jgi:hypothetical protein
MAKPKAKYDFSRVPDESLAEVLRLGELTLENTIRFGLASDQRAMVQAGIFGATSAASLTVWDGENAFAVGILVLTMAAACGFAVWAARPTYFYGTGYQPRLLARNPLSERQVRQFVAEDVQLRIDDNNALLEQAGHWTVASYTAAAAGAVAAGIAYAVGLV